MDEVEGEASAWSTTTIACPSLRVFVSSVPEYDDATTVGGLLIVASGVVDGELFV